MRGCVRGWVGACLCGCLLDCLFALYLVVSRWLVAFTRGGRKGVREPVHGDVEKAQADLVGSPARHKDAVSDHHA